MRSLDINSFFTSIFPEETTEICTNNRFKTSGIVSGFKKNEFTSLLSLATKKLYFIFKIILYKQINRVAME